jgi:hypothetical protein
MIEPKNGGTKCGGRCRCFLFARLMPEINLHKLRSAFKRLTAELRRVTSEVIELREALSRPGNEARNLIFHTRVHGMSDAHGIGYGVTVFVREEVLAVIRSDPSLYGAPGRP